jgi:DNA-binding Xre family transcriptional regulator
MEDYKVIKNCLATELRIRIENKGIGYRTLAFNSRCTAIRAFDCIQGNSLPNLWTLTLMAEYLDCTVNELLGYGCIDDVNNMVDINAFTSFPHEDEFAEYVRDRILARMREIHINQEQLSELTSIKLATIERWLWICPRLPQVMKFLQIAEALDCTPSDLLGY